MFGGIRRLVVLVLFALAVLAPLPSHAFCGFYVNTGDQPLFNEATRVALMRIGMRTVMSIQNDYKGPTDDFALVIPVPIVLERENVRTLPQSVFDHLDRLSSPRLVEYWEQDPCPPEMEDYDNKEGGTGTRAKGEEGSMGNPNVEKLVTVERQFKVDEYDVVVLSALDSGALETWLHENKYKIPAGAEPYLRPYVQEGSKFFVAKVDVNRVHFRWGRAKLSPLRFFYDTPDFKLPIRLGLINSNGVQDLLVFILGEQRYETANYENVFIPTNYGLREDTRTKFNSFYAALFDQTLAKRPRAVVTEYAWSPQSCDPCPAGAGPLQEEDASLIGGDVIKNQPSTMTLTRLHARYGKSSIGDDLVFRQAEPVIGGREVRKDGVLDHGAKPDGTNNFQARYIINHPWTGPATCANPRFGSWGGPPSGITPPDPKPNPLADRNLKAADYILDDREERSSTGSHSSDSERGGFRGIPIPGTNVHFHPEWMLRSLIHFGSWSSNDAAAFELTSYGIGFLVAAIVARRRRVGMFKTMGLFVVFGAVALAVGSASLARHSISPRDFGRLLILARLVVLVLPVGLAGMAASRTNLRVIWACVPVLAGLADAFRQKLYIDALATSEFVGLPLDQMSRIWAESSSDAYEPIIVGASMSGCLIVGMMLLGQRPREGAHWRNAMIAFAIAAGARLALVELTPHEVLAAIAFAGAAFVAARADGFPPVLAAFTGVVLLDLATKLHISSMGLGSISGESVDDYQVGRILADTIKYENRHLVVAALDLALLGGVAFLARPRIHFIDWRTAFGAAAIIFLCATPFEWYGTREHFASLDALHGHNATLSGPTLFARGTQLYASPSPDLEPVLYGPAIADKLASADSGTPPLLIGEADRPFSTLLDAVAPLVRLHQTDFRLIQGIAPPSELGAYGNLVSARGVHAVTVDILPKLAFGGRGDTTSPSVALRLDGERVNFQLIKIDGANVISIPSSVGKKTVALKGSRDDWWKVSEALRYQRINPEAALAVPAGTPLTTIRDLCYVLEDQFKVTRVVLSSDVAVLDNL